MTNSLHFEDSPQHAAGNFKLLITGGRVIDPSNNLDGIYDITVEDGEIKEVKSQGSGVKSKPKKRITNHESQPTTQSDSELRTIDATGLIVTPGLIDMHVHLREPGFEYKETIKSGTEAAVRGGFTSICCMPNTEPVNDNGAVTEFILRKASEEGMVTLYPVGATTKGLNGEILSEVGELKDAGCVAISDDGKFVMNSLIMRRAMEYAKTFDMLIISHCEDLNLSEDGTVNEGLVSLELGLRGRAGVSEEIAIYRDIALAEYTGAKIHIAHVSTAGAVRIIRDAKSRGINVTAETCPQYFTLTEDAVRRYDTNAKMNPPLRTVNDVEAIKKGIKDGTIDVIATDHAPHAPFEKEVEFDYAPFGIVGLETALPLSMRLVKDGLVTLGHLIEMMSYNPAKILGIKKGGIKVGSIADITIIDPEQEVIIDSSKFKSKGRNTPFNGFKVSGVSVITIYKGKAYKSEW